MIYSREATRRFPAETRAGESTTVRSAVPPSDRSPSLLDASTRPRAELSARTFFILGTALVVLAFWLRLSYAEFGKLTDGDQAAITSCAIGLERGITQQRFYNYPEQLGYYELARFVYRLLPPGDLTRMRDVMIAFSAVGAALLTAFAVLAFPRELSRRVRLLTGFVLILFPALWRESQYGNTATLSTAIVFLAFLVLSRVRSLAGAAIAGLLLAGAMLVRSDAILVAPALAYYAWKREGGSWRDAIAPLAGVAIAILVSRIRSKALHLEALSDSVLSVVFNTRWRGHFQECMFWGLGPTTLVCAAAGWPSLGRMALLWKTLLFQTLPPLLFYLPFATSARYGSLFFVPVAICAAAGIDSVMAVLYRKHPLIRWPGLVLLFVFVCQHMFLVQSNNFSGNAEEWIKPLTVQWSDGPNFYGALLWQKRTPVPEKFYTRNGAAKDLKALALENCDKKERWGVIVDFWDDMNANSFQLISQADRSYKFNDYIITFCDLELEFFYRSMIDALGPDTNDNRKTLQRLHAVKRLFRQTADTAGPVLNKFRLLYGTNQVSIATVGESGELIEVKLPPESRPASAASRPGR